jgi:hypothetical protein
MRSHSSKAGSGEKRALPEFNSPPAEPLENWLLRGPYFAQVATHPSVGLKPVGFVTTIYSNPGKFSQRIANVKWRFIR